MPVTQAADEPQRGVLAADSGGVLWVLFLFVQLPLICNPGYFSHDELEWWARADVAHWRDMPWAPWSDIAAFQYRPLTFNVWLVLAHGLAATPYLMHLAVVALGTANALLLAACVQHVGASRRGAAVAAAVFVLQPYVAYTHGWTATLADILVLGAGLLALRCVQRIGPSTRRPGLVACAFGVVALIAGALLCKESAVVLPALLLGGLYQHPRRAVVWAIIAAAALVVATYLLLRLGVILHPPHGNGAYAWAIGHVPRRAAEYLLFPFMPPMLEVGPVLLKSPARLLLATLGVVALLVSLATAGWRWPLAWLALVATSLAPVLILGTAYNQYAYLATAAAVAAVAVAWPRLTKAPRGAILIVATVATLHGAAIMQRMRAIGGVQQQFHTDLVRRLADRTSPLAVAATNPADCWLLQRFVAGVPSYRGVALAQRVRVVGCDGVAEGSAFVLMTSSGRLLDASPR